MKGIFEILLWLGLLVVFARCREAAGYLRIANAIAGEKHLVVFLDGVNVKKGGYGTAAVTGRLRLDSGKHVLRFHVEGLKTANTAVLVSPGEVLTVIPHLVWRLDSRSGETKCRIGVLRLRLQLSETQKVATLISVCRKSGLKLWLHDADQGWFECGLSRLQPYRVGILQPRGYLPLRLAGRRLGSIPVGSDDNYIVVMYDDRNGRVAMFTFKEHAHGGRRPPQQALPLPMPVPRR